MTTADLTPREIAARVDAARGLSRPTPREPEARGNAGGNDARWIATASLIAGVPVTAIVAGTSNGNVFAIAVAWGGIALVNMAHALSRRPR